MASAGRVCVSDPHQEPSTPLFVAVKSHNGAKLVVAVRGEVDMASAPHLHVVVLKMIEAHQVRHIDIDAAEMTFLDATGMTALIALYRHAEQHGITIRMENVHPFVLHVLRIVDLVDYLGIGEPPDM
ncbi:STAS domain-containing protein [Paractinoplanes pyxinae]|uniref:STAS domain-containing protein n=1 Tax=Paractinoplanes pyxinae TaxID=2997416 RepID=UPI0034DAF5DE